MFASRKLSALAGELTASKPEHSSAAARFAGDGPTAKSAAPRPLKKESSNHFNSVSAGIMIA